MFVLCGSTWSGATTVQVIGTDIHSDFVLSSEIRWVRCELDAVAVLDDRVRSY